MVGAHRAGAAGHRLRSRVAFRAASTTTRSGSTTVECELSAVPARGVLPAIKRIPAVDAAHSALGTVAVPRSRGYRFGVLALCLLGQWLWIYFVFALGNTFWQVP
ncbi:hypothetical protein [Microbacterium sp. CH12i]|uniref:hypothetical protein n=1 Tax=Microbacterium sp. CH12i TaxID=1479651 RepID=UPI001F466D8B|nr:hypothetical protein [Microbacterium sp. CH12i]